MKKNIQEKKETMTKLKLAKIICEKINGNTSSLQHKKIGEVKKIVYLFVEEIINCFVNGNEIQFRSFGTFKKVQAKAKVGRCPKFPEKEIAIPPTNKIKFKIHKSFKDKLNRKN